MTEVRDGTVHCDERGCTASVLHTCQCRRCRSEPEEDERFHACKEHLASVGAQHRRVRGYRAEWS